MSGEYPNLFEKKCDESSRLQDAKAAASAITDSLEHYRDSPLPVDRQKADKLREAKRLVQEVANRERGHIGVRLAGKYTRNPNYRHHEPGDPGVIDQFEEWTSDRGGLK